MMFIALGLLLSANAITANELQSMCPDGYDSWTDILTSQWTMDENWEDALVAGQTVYPAGFRSYSLGIYNEPPVCMFVPGSRNKKIEILIESPMDNVNLCISDADYDGWSNNNVGSVTNCGTGKLYACFTAARAEGRGNFGFIVKCEEGCEDMEIDLWIRVRLSDQTWDAGKTGVADDLEHWCEGERGNTFTDSNGDEQMYYTYPSDLIPDEPSQYPFHIEQIFGRNSGSQTKPHIWLVSVLALVGLACLFM